MQLDENLNQKKSLAYSVTEPLFSRCQRFFKRFLMCDGLTLQSRWNGEEAGADPNECTSFFWVLFPLFLVDSFAPFLFYFVLAGQILKLHAVRT